MVWIDCNFPQLLLCEPWGLLETPVSKSRDNCISGALLPFKLICVWHVSLASSSFSRPTGLLKCFPIRCLRKGEKRLEFPKISGSLASKSGTREQPSSGIAHHKPFQTDAGWALSGECVTFTPSDACSYFFSCGTETLLMITHSRLYGSKFILQNGRTHYFTPCNF